MESSMPFWTRGIINGSALLTLFTLTVLLQLTPEHRQRVVLPKVMHSALLSSPESVDANESRSTDAEVELPPVAYQGDLFLLENYFGEADPAWTELEIGNALCRKGQYRPAVELWEAMLHKYPYSEIQIAALENIASSHRHFRNQDEAISTYEHILTRLPLTRLPLAKGCNAGHRACAALTDLWLEKGDKQKALKYTELALTEHPYSDFCGMVAMSRREILEDRAKVLRSAIASNSPVYLRPGP